MSHKMVATEFSSKTSMFFLSKIVEFRAFLAQFRWAKQRVSSTLLQRFVYWTTEKQQYFRYTSLSNVMAFDTQNKNVDWLQVHIMAMNHLSVEVIFIIYVLPGYIRVVKVSYLGTHWLSANYCVLNERSWHDRTLTGGLGCCNMHQQSADWPQPLLIWFCDCMELAHCFWLGWSMHHACKAPGGVGGIKGPVKAASISPPFQWLNL